MSFQFKHTYSILILIKSQFPLSFTFTAIHCNVSTSSYLLIYTRLMQTGNY